MKNSRDGDWKEGRSWGRGGLQQLRWRHRQVELVKIICPGLVLLVQYSIGPVRFFFNIIRSI